MTIKEILTQLKALGNVTVSTRNLKYGSGDDQFGVKMGDLRTIAKKIKSDHELGKDLWKTGNLEARLLATLIVVPKKLSAVELEEMVSVGKFYQLADWLNSYVVKEYPDKEALRQKWMVSEDIMTGRAAWSLTAGRVVRSPEGLDLTALLDRIESEMPDAAPEVQWTMNTTLAQIGICFPEHRDRALAIGEKLGVYRDYPVSKGCTSPFAPIWINEMVSRQK
jgi:3-methyladenine DNA glycosylase AlkD